ncbi:RNA polymerase recycling motor HelD [Amphibacillus cookii]|uniref:RNA polymerase recycling motor HelD n=1 Tax=Amphibacillus cookii TaxID=767787 RepID=UPI00195B22F0|nr:RNA polymerase recycling motor HelD [Amphibacillus cookii]MBM7540920.1 DNA helicase-2/ATP-dependent DNA helicase PcrA [Amphibacillus cookii]
MTKHEKDWQEEYQRVKRVSSYIDRKIHRLTAYMKTLKDRVIDIRKDFWDDVTVNLTELDDAIETQASLKQQAEFLSERERSHGQLSQQLDKLLRLRETPYFGRIDFIEAGEQTEERIYIGTSSLMDEKEEAFLVYDWRAPISSMYYDYPPGRASYQAIDQQVEGEMTLKRQYVIKQGELTGMFDTGLTIGDHLLQSVLGKSSDTTMKSIVATIQREQNKIIRNEKSKMLVVQGVAGSGKTSAALQRVAYLLYRYREQLTADQMILFSPNPLFNSYVSRVLPELGEDNIKQMTFYHYIEQQLGRRFVIESPFEQLEFALANSDNEANERLVGMRYKSSELFKRHVDHFLEHLKESGMAFRNIRFRSDLLLSKTQLSRYFYSFSNATPIQVRLEKMSQWILAELKKQERQYMKAKWVENEIELLSKEDFQEAYQALEEESSEDMETYHDVDKETDYLKRKVIREQLKPLRKKIKRFYFMDTKKTYLQLFEQADVDQPLTRLEWQAISDSTIKRIKDNFLTWEDATPFLYFERMLMGFEANRAIKYIFLDEAQDYSPFQLRYLAHIYPNSRMTLLGDINQAIYYHAMTDQNVLVDQGDQHVERITLLRSYRSTRPIVEFTRSFMPNGNQIEPFNREGEMPVVIEVDNETIAEYKLYTAISDYLNHAHQNIAVITKNKAMAKALAKLLKQSYQDVHFVGTETHTFKQGIQVLPAYLAKGIEFDAVVVYDASVDQYVTELDRNLLYTACTRAMHALTVIAIDGVSAFLKEVPAPLYDFYKVHEVNAE